MKFRVTYRVDGRVICREDVHGFIDVSIRAREWLTLPTSCRSVAGMREVAIEELDHLEPKEVSRELRLVS
jgi:hypothetical protein